MPSEFALIDEFLGRFGRPGTVARIAAGDDCAVLAPSREELCVTTDALVENVHFTLPAFSLEDVGHKALAVNLSDLAAMGATPRWFLCAIAMPRTFGKKEVLALGRGMSALARANRIALVGGNFTAAAELSITVTAAGSCPPRKALTRAGARPGDALYVSGTLGDARLGVGALATAGNASSLSSRHRAFLAGRQKRPEPRIGLGLLARGFASAAIDLSDGLGQDLGHLCRASKVGARVALSQLPVSPAVCAASGSAEAAWAEAAAGGEDYELLLAIPSRRARAFEAAASRRSVPVTRIGELTAGKEIRFLDPGGRVVPSPAGHDHFG